MTPLRRLIATSSVQAAKTNEPYQLVRDLQLPKKRVTTLILLLYYPKHSQQLENAEPSYQRHILCLKKPL